MGMATKVSTARASIKLRTCFPMLPALRPEKCGAKITNKQATLPYSVSSRMLCRQMALLDPRRQDLTA